MCVDVEVFCEGRTAGAERRRSPETAESEFGCSEIVVSDRWLHGGLKLGDVEGVVQ